MKALPFKDDIEREQQRGAEKQRLVYFRETAARLDGDVWQMETAGGVTRVISRRSTGEKALLCTIHADALGHEIDLISGAFDLLAFFLLLQDRAAAKVRELTAALDAKAKTERRGDFAANAAMLCQKVSFHRFLETKGAGGPIAGALAADTRLKGLLAIISKTELNDDPAALARFKALRGDYDLWMRGDAP